MIRENGQGPQQLTWRRFYLLVTTIREHFGELPGAFDRAFYNEVARAFAGAVPADETAEHNVLLGEIRQAEKLWKICRQLQDGTPAHMDARELYNLASAIMAGDETALEIADEMAGIKICTTCQGHGCGDCAYTGERQEVAR